MITIMGITILTTNLIITDTGGRDGFWFPERSGLAQAHTG
jgi:hypothetical protein